MKPIRKKIGALNFTLLSPEQIKRLSSAKIVTPELYNIDGYPVDGGLMDLKLGAIDPGVRCRTCGGRIKECLGHPGSIDLARSVIHLKYVPLIELCLRCFCGECGKLMLDDKFLTKLSPAERAKKAKDCKKCPHCQNEQVKIKLDKPTSFYQDKTRVFPTEIREILVNITDEELRKVGVNPRTCRPEWAILTMLLVPPVTVRPSIILESGERSEDDLTHKLSDIIRANQRLWENLNAGAPEVIIEDLWDLLQFHITTFFDNSVARIPPARHRSGQPLKTITERIKGKEGRLRKNLAGKRVNYSARTVISPDPSIEINEVGIPFQIAKIVTVAETVTELNLEKLKKLIETADKYPGANYIIRTDGKRKKITDEMNIHSPQTEEARAEAKVLLDVKQNLISPKNNTNFMGCEVDAITGGYLLGRHEFSKEDANQLLFESGVDFECTKKSISGLELFSKILPKIDFVNDSITIKKGEITGGIIDKTAFGGGSGELIKELDRTVGRMETFETIKKAFNLGKNYLSNRGITLSVEDLNLDKRVVDAGKKIIQDAEEKTQETLDLYNAGKLEIIPGKTAEESREIQILKILNEVRTKVGSLVKKEFLETNAVNHMIKSGGGGNILNITQMASCVGQQVLRGGRIDLGYNERTLSFFEKGDLSPKARGFINSPFIKGLRPDEFFFGAITGRDSLMDTALRTPKSGYLYRRLANALQDLRVEYDGTVRDSNNRIIQFQFGDDGIDVSQIHKDGQIAPGEAIGIITAQSFGESSTQMVLNTFHMAGVAEMQVTSGLPRIIEIFDARKTPSSPKMEIYLDKEFNNEGNARVFAEKIKEVTLKEISSEVSFREIYKLKEKLKATIISGIKGVKQILIVKRNKDFVIITLGTNLKEMLKLKEVDKYRLISNDFYEVAKVFGIEAARQLIINEVVEVLNSQGLDIDYRHSKLIADAMTDNGIVKGVTRMGIITQKSSILARATFETPDKQFVNASIKGTQDKLTSVIENIILNQPVPIGAGLPGLFVKVVGPLVKEEKDKKLAKSKIVEEANK